MIVTRESRDADIGLVVRVHQQAFPGFFLSLLGTEFLRELYRGFHIDEAGVLLVVEIDERGVSGFVAGTGDPDGLFSRLRRRKGAVMALRMLPALLKHPVRVADRLWSAVRYRGERPDHLRGYWLLSSLAVHSDVGRRGVGQALVNEFCARARAAAAPGVYLLTDGTNNESALHFYTRLGFTQEQVLRRANGREMFLLTMRFAR
jgi:ribosomal protein S18 acetylase RimI-like enzyme